MTEAEATGLNKGDHMTITPKVQEATLIGDQCMEHDGLHGYCRCTLYDTVPTVETVTQEESHD